MQRFAARCQAGVPSWLIERFEAFENDAEGARALAIDLLTEQVQDLAANGADHIHFYTLNKPDITKQACAALNGTVDNAGVIAVKN